MKTLLTTSLIFVLLSLASHAYALPDCPKDQSQTYHNCFGTYTFANGEKYVGEYKDDKPHGKGTYTWASGANAGDKYVGEWKDDEHHGKGTYTFANGEKYVGEYKDDKRHGQGTLTFASGDVYAGEYKDNKMHGEGTYTHADGAIFIGEFKDNKMNGQGTLWVEGREIKGIWADDKYLYESAESARSDCAEKAGKANTEYAAKKIEKTCLAEKGLKP